jgi:transposase
LPRNDQWKAPTPDLEGHRKRLREALGNTLSDEFVDVILGKLVEALRPGLYDQLCLADARGRPVAFHLTSGEAAVL